MSEVIAVVVDSSFEWQGVRWIGPVAAMFAEDILLQFPQPLLGLAFKHFSSEPPDATVRIVVSKENGISFNVVTCTPFGYSTTSLNTRTTTGHGRGGLNPCKPHVLSNLAVLSFRGVWRDINNRQVVDGCNTRTVQPRMSYSSSLRPGQTVCSSCVPLIFPEI